MDWPSFTCGIAFAGLLLIGSVVVALLLIYVTDPPLFPDEYSRSIEDNYE